MKFLVLKFLVTLSLMFSFSVGAKATKPLIAPAIHVASNIVDDTMILQVTPPAQVPPASANQKPSEAGLRDLRELNVKTRSISSFPRPIEIVNEEVLGLVLSKETLVLIAQDTRGDGDQPVIFQMERATGTWQRRSRIKCRSFDTLIVTRLGFEISCEADPQTNKKAFIEKVALAKLSGAPAKLVLPLEEFNLREANRPQRQFKLEGTMFNWSAIRLQADDKPYYVMTAIELSK